MRKIFVILLLISPAVFASSSNLRVLLDPGHGGSDAGTVQGSAKESMIALQVAQKLRKILSLEKNMSVQLTREKDINVALKDRVAKAEEMSADIFVSIHVNSAPDARAKGLEIYFQNMLPSDEDALYLAAAENKVDSASLENADAEPLQKNDVTVIIEDLKRQNKIRESYQLGLSLLQAWDEHSKTKSNALRQAPFFVVTQSKIPAVLVEIGYLTHAKESQKLLSPEFQQDLAHRIAEGILAFKNSDYFLQIKNLN